MSIKIDWKDTARKQFEGLDIGDVFRYTASGCYHKLHIKVSDSDSRELLAPWHMLSKRRGYFVEPAKITKIVCEGADPNA